MQFFLYLKKYKAEVTRQLLYNTKLRQIKLKVTKAKTRDKIDSIIIFYKIQKNKAEKTRYDLNITYYNYIIENT